MRISAPLSPRQGRDRGLHPLGEAPERHAAEQAVEHRAEGRVARPLVVRASTDELLPDRPPGIELVALAQQRGTDPAGDGDRAGVRLLSAGDQLQERGFALPVAADDPDAVAGVDAEGDAAQDRTAPVRLRDVLEVDEVADQRTTARTGSPSRPRSHPR